MKTEGIFDSICFTGMELAAYHYFICISIVTASVSYINNADQAEAIWGGLVIYRVSQNEGWSGIGIHVPLWHNQWYKVLSVAAGL